MATLESEASLFAGAVCVLSKVVAGILVTVVAVTEKSTSWMLFSFKDRDDAPVVPVKVTYRIDCKMTGEVIVEDTVLWDFEAIPNVDSHTPSNSVEIELLPEVNRIVDQNNDAESRTVTVTATFFNGQQTTSVDYTVNGLRNLE